MSRIQRRTRARLGQRAEEGGDLYAQEQAFLRFAAARDPIHIEQWLKGIPCRVLRLDGTLPIDSLVAMICDEIKQQTV